MINSAIEWIEILGFALLIAFICVVIVLIALVIGCFYCLRAIFELDFKWIVE